MMDTIKEIAREMRERAAEIRASEMKDELSANVAKLFEIDADRIEAACDGCTQFKRAKKMAIENLCLRKENARIRAALKPVLECEGIKNCIEKGCESCRYNGNGCNSRDVVDAVKDFNESGAKR